MLYNAGVTLSHNGLKKFETTSAGASVLGTLMEVDSSSTVASQIQVRNSEGGLAMYTDGGISSFRTIEGDGASPRNAIRMIELGAVELYHNSVKRLETFSTGVEVSGTQIVLDSNSTSGASLNIRNSEGGVRLVADGGDASLAQTNSVGAFEKSWMSFQQDAGVTLNYNGAARLATTSAGVTVTGQVTTAGLPTSPNHLTTKNYVDGVSFMTAGAYSGGVQFTLPTGTTWADYRKIEIYCSTGGVNDITSASATSDVLDAVGLTQFRILAYSSQQSDVAYIQSISTNSFSCHGVDGDYVRLVRGYRK